MIRLRPPAKLRLLEAIVIIGLGLGVAHLVANQTLDAVFCVGVDECRSPRCHGLTKLPPAVCP